MEAPFACPDPECSFIFNEIGPLRRRMNVSNCTDGLLDTRKNITNIEILPEEMSLFAELKM